MAKREGLTVTEEKQSHKARIKTKFLSIQNSCETGNGKGKERHQETARANKWTRLVMKAKNCRAIHVARCM